MQVSGQRQPDVICIWTLQLGQMVRVLQGPHTGPITCLCLIPCPPTAVAAVAAAEPGQADDGGLPVLGAEQEQGRGCSGSSRGPAARDSRAHRRIKQADQVLLVSCGLDGVVCTWDLVSGQCLRVLEPRQPPLLPPRHWGAAGGGGQRPLSPPPAPPVTTTCLAASPEGRLVYGGGADGALRVWEVQSGQLLHVVQGTAAATAGSTASPTPPGPARPPRGVALHRCFSDSEHMQAKPAGLLQPAAAACPAPSVCGLGVLQEAGLLFVQSWRDSPEGGGRVQVYDIRGAGGEARRAKGVQMPLLEEEEEAVEGSCMEAACPPVLCYSLQGPKGGSSSSGGSSSDSGSGGGSSSGSAVPAAEGRGALGAGWGSSLHCLPRSAMLLTWGPTSGVCMWEPCRVGDGGMGRDGGG